MRDYPDGELELLGVKNSLFDALVCSQLHVAEHRTEEAYFWQIKVKPTSKEILLASITPGEIVLWNRSEISDDADLRYSGIFDFDELDYTYRDFRYVRARLLTTSDIPNYTDVLVDADKVQLFDVSDTESK